MPSFASPTCHEPAPAPVQPDSSHNAGHEKSLPSQPSCVCLSDVPALFGHQPDTPARRIVDRDEITVVVLHRACHQRTDCERPGPEPTIESLAVDVARMAGFIPKMRQPTPAGNGETLTGMQKKLQNHARHDSDQHP